MPVINNYCMYLIRKSVCNGRNITQYLFLSLCQKSRSAALVVLLLKLSFLIVLVSILVRTEIKTHTKKKKTWTWTLIYSFFFNFGMLLHNNDNYSQYKYHFKSLYCIKPSRSLLKTNIQVEFDAVNKLQSLIYCYLSPLPFYNSEKNKNGLKVTEEEDVSLTCKGLTKWLVQLLWMNADVSQFR